MKRTIGDYFGSASSPSPSKKPKVVEGTSEVHRIVTPQAVAANSPPVPQQASSSAPSSSNELTPQEAERIETNRKKALARQWLLRITEPSWREVLEEEFEKPYMLSLVDFLSKEKAAGVRVFPPEDDVFNALNMCPLDSVKVVMLGQDPYHQPSQAHGLCFSVLPPTAPPSSLRNMYKELKSNYPDITIPKHGNLESWARQGILMLNACLTVRYNNANSHEGKGWEKFTDACIAAVSKKLKSVIFLLWGSYAQKKAKIADEKKHILLKAAHPSGLSAHKGFFGCKHFTEVNKILKQIGKQPIDWQLPASGIPMPKPSASSGPSSNLTSAPPSSTPESSSTPSSSGATASSDAPVVSSESSSAPATTVQTTSASV